MGDAEDRRRAANDVIAYHSPISYRLTAERTSYQSQMIPVTPYILVACAETFTRYAELMRIIDAAMPAEEIGRLARRPGSQVNTVFLWSIANFYLLGRKIFTQFDPSMDRLDDTHTVLDFWDRAARGFRGDGTRQADDAGGAVRVYDDAVINAVVSAAVEVDDELRPRLKRFNATLVNFLFLHYFDTRVGTGDTGPYELGDGRTLIVRDFYRMSQSDFWWSDVAAEVPFSHLVAGLVLRDTEVRITDFGTSVTTPEDYLERLVGFSLFTTDGNADGSLTPVPLDEIDGLMSTIRRVQSQHYRNIAAMSRDEMIRCGAYVYFTFLRPFAEIAGVADQLDWTVPRDVPEPVYDLLVALGSDVDTQASGLDGEQPDTYYQPIGPPPITEGASGA